MLHGGGPGAVVRARVQVHGLVQGVGFRPFVHALAHRLGLSGHVVNTADGVLVEVEGTAAAVDAFLDQVRHHPPALAVVESVTSQRIPARGGSDFEIRDSRGGPGRTAVPPDVATCADCLDDLSTPGNRRHRHPFVSCTSCGPRFTIVTALAYDRPNTTMADFAMCDACAREYADPTDRRFHAQPVCCPECGPTLSLVRPGAADLAGEEAASEARRLLREGAVLAVKGLGGYHLACDAENPQTVALLRKRKQRGDKPFAVMVHDVTTAARVAALGAADRAVLTGHHRPIVLLPRDGAADPPIRIAEGVAPGNPDLGVMLAYTPLHHLLLGIAGDVPGARVLVMTSGNVAGEPIVTDDADARVRLAALVDGWLTHDRRIHVPCDDSVVRVVEGVELPVRRSRGYAPMPVHLPFSTPPALAVGGDLKNTFCLAEGRAAWLSAHVGDMDDVRTQVAFEAAEAHLEGLTGIRPGAVAADRHPGYRSRRWAARWSTQGRPLVSVQHHHAHVASTMADAGHDGTRPVLGVAFDGTGYGDDGAAWGGEFLRADYGGCQRVGHLAYVPLPGGDAGVQNPCRMALSHLRAAGVAPHPDLPAVQACSSDELGLLARQLETGFGCVPTSSMGRLFDAVASLVGVCHRAGYEAQAAIELEGLARRLDLWDRRVGGYAFGAPDVADGSVDCGPVVAAVVDDVRAGVGADLVAARFHRGVVDLVVAVATRVREETGTDEVTLSGGVFVNTVLTAGCSRALGGAGFRVLRHRSVPPTDAGLALGQLAVLAHRLHHERRQHQAATPPETEMPCV